MSVPASPTTNTHERCVKIKVDVERLFITGDNYDDASSLCTTTSAADISASTYAAYTGICSVDMDWEYRKYSVTTGWRIVSGQTNNPGLQDFAAVEVDFAEFTKAAETYSGALSGLTIAGTALFTAVFAMNF